MSCRTSWLQSTRQLNDEDRSTTDRGWDKLLQLSPHFNKPIQISPLLYHPYVTVIFELLSKLSKSLDAYVPIHIAPVQVRRSPRSLFGSGGGHIDGHVLGSDSEQPRAAGAASPGPCGRCRTARSSSSSPQPVEVGGAAGRRALTRQDFER